MTALSPRWVPLAEAATYAHKSRSTIRRWIDRDLVSATKVGGRIEVDLNTIDNLRTPINPNDANGDMTQ